MQIELPEEIARRVQSRAAARPGVSEIDVLRQGLDALDSLDSERAAIQEGIDAMNQGRVQDFHEFDREFRAAHGIAANE
jgi:predicted transcriptional regulator